MKVVPEKSDLFELDLDDPACAEFETRDIQTVALFKEQLEELSFTDPSESFVTSIMDRISEQSAEPSFFEILKQWWPQTIGLAASILLLCSTPQNREIFDSSASHYTESDEPVFFQASQSSYSELLDLNLE